MPTVKVLALSLPLTLAAIPPLTAQESPSSAIQGTVTSDGQPIPRARVTLTLLPTSQSSAPKTTLTSPTGTFSFPSLPLGQYRIRVTALGYSFAERTITLSDTSPRVLEIPLLPTPTPTDAVVVTGTLRETYVSASPVKVQVITSQFLERNVTNNLMDAVQTINGLTQQIDCGVCYTNNIRINGMEGPYTAILIDGMPIMGALASVYGLNGINPALIERLEIIKGPSSTLYGSEAMGGVVNVITKDPRFTPKLSIDTYRSSNNEQNVELAVSPTRGALSSLFSASYYTMQHFLDRNGDNFSDVPIGHRLALFGKFNYQPNTQRPLFGMTAKFYDEDRFGGVSEWTTADRGSSTVYGESIRTRRGEILAVQSLDALLRGGVLQLSLSAHHQDSYYGDTPFRATQIIGHTNILVDRTLGRRHKLLTGITLRYNSYKDNSPANIDNNRQLTPGFLLEDEFSATDNVTILAGSRIDYHEAHGTILSPRMSVKWDAASHTTVRLNAGTGFRVVNLFTEDHAALTGARHVVITEALRPERSASLSLNLNQILEFGINNMMIDVDAFYTRFSNKIVPDYDSDPNLIVYDNLNGYAVSRGLALAFNQNFAKVPFLYSVGITYQDVYTVNNDTRSQEFFAPRIKGNLSASYTFATPGITLDYTGVLTGPMRMPQYAEPYQRPLQSPTYAVHNLQATYALKRGFSLYSSVKNLFNYTQGTPLIDPTNPFGPHFDTNYVWGPIRGRHIILGLRYTQPR